VRLFVDECLSPTLARRLNESVNHVVEIAISGSITIAAMSESR
jgi:hypothetical protein